MNAQTPFETDADEIARLLDWARSELPKAGWYADEPLRDFIFALECAEENERLERDDNRRDAEADYRHELRRDL